MRSEPASGRPNFQNSETMAWVSYGKKTAASKGRSAIQGRLTITEVRQAGPPFHRNVLRRSPTDRGSQSARTARIVSRSSKLAAWGDVGTLGVQLAALLKKGLASQDSGGTLGNRLIQPCWGRPNERAEARLSGEEKNNQWIARSSPSRRQGGQKSPVAKRLRRVGWIPGKGKRGGTFVPPCPGLRDDRPRERLEKKVSNSPTQLLKKTLQKRYEGGAIPAAG